MGASVRWPRRAAVSRRTSPHRAGGRVARAIAGRAAEAVSDAAPSWHYLADAARLAHRPSLGRLRIACGPARRPGGHDPRSLASSRGARWRPSRNLDSHPRPAASPRPSGRPDRRRARPLARGSRCSDRGRPRAGYHSNRHGVGALRTCRADPLGPFLDGARRQQRTGASGSSQPAVGARRAASRGLFGRPCARRRCASSGFEGGPAAVVDPLTGACSRRRPLSAPPSVVDRSCPTRRRHPHHEIPRSPCP